MTRRRATLLCLTLAASLPTAGADEFKESIRPLLDQYCYRCHGSGERVRGDVNLAQIQDANALHRDPKTWETIRRQIEEGEMPPEDEAQPNPEDREKLLTGIRALLDNPPPDAIPMDPGRVVLHRLSRREYNNTVRDLFGITSRPADQFPSEGGGGGGFDNNADTLFIPPILMERYLAAARTIAGGIKPEQLTPLGIPSGMPEDQAARTNAAHHASRAFRRPVDAGEVDRYMAPYEAARKAGRSFEEGLRSVVTALLVSPHFLFRVELDQPGDEPYRISGYELASRLSYFLWSTMPDPELMELAGTGTLHDPVVLGRQVERMLNDPKSRRLAEDFAGQWLGIDLLDTTANPDPDRFKTYTVELRDAMKREAFDFFHHILKENRSLLEVLDADYSFLNNELAGHYGLEGVEGSEFRKVALTDRNRGGVLGMAGILTVTSYSTRTSPVLRGKWVLEEILGTPPPPPPPLVEGLRTRSRDGLTLRERLEKHRSDPNCAGCHKKMDPLGFGLENFDAIGRWRTEDGQKPVDATGELPSGEKFTGPAEMKEVLLKNKPLYIRNLTERMLAYALGRGLEYYDFPTVRQISAELEKTGYGGRTLVMEIVKSYPFQYRSNTSPK